MLRVFFLSWMAWKEPGWLTHSEQRRDETLASSVQVFSSDLGSWGVTDTVPFCPPRRAQELMAKWLNPLIWGKHLTSWQRKRREGKARPPRRPLQSPLLRFSHTCDSCGLSWGLERSKLFIVPSTWGPPVPRMCLPCRFPCSELSLPTPRAPEFLAPFFCQDCCQRQATNTIHAFNRGSWRRVGIEKTLWRGRILRNTLTWWDSSPVFHTKAALPVSRLAFLELVRMCRMGPGGTVQIVCHLFLWVQNWL